MDQERTAAIRPLTLWKSSNQEPQKGTLKQSSILFADQKFDRSRKRLNRQHVSDYTPCASH